MTINENITVRIPDSKDEKDAEPCVFILNI